MSGPDGERGRGFPSNLSYRSPGFNIRGMALNTRHVPGTPPGRGRKPGYLFIVFHEEGSLEINGVAVVCPAGSLVVISPQAGRPFRDDTWDCRTSWLEAAGAAAERVILKHGLPLDCVLDIGQPAVRQRYFLDLYGEVFRRERPNRRILLNLLENWTLDICGELHGRETITLPISLWNLRVVLNYASSLPWSLKEMAGMAGVSVSYLVKGFKRCFGISPMQYVSRIRIMHAACLLHYGRVSVAKAAAEIGYADSAGFASAFKKYFGVTPKDIQNGEQRVAEDLLKRISLQYAFIMARDGLSIHRIAKETGFPSLDGLRKAYIAEYGMKLDDQIRLHQADDPIEKPKSLASSYAFDIQWHSPDLALLNMGIGSSHRKGFSGGSITNQGYLCFVLHDEAMAQRDGQMVSCPPDSVFIYPPGRIPLCGNPDRPWRHSWLLVSGPWAQRQMRSLGIPLETAISLPDPRASERYLSAIQAEVLQHKEPDGRIIRNLVHNWLLELSRDEDDLSVPASMADIRRFMEQSFQEDVGSEQLAGTVYLSTAHFRRCFKAYQGIPPMRYVLCLRLLHAAHLLAHGGRTLTQAGREVGYANIPQFARHFKDYLGIIPSDMSYPGRQRS